MPTTTVDIPGRDAPHRVDAWCARNVACCRRATRLLAVALAALLAARAGAAAPPDADDVIRADATLAAWLEAWSLPAPGRIEASAPLRNAAGVCIILRHRGRVVGTGMDMRGDDRALRRAAGRAFNAALADPTILALPEAMRADVGRHLVHELEIAGPPEPLLGRTWPDAARGVEPGIDGFAMRVDDRWSALFPALLRATGRAGEPARVMPTLAVDLDLPPRAPEILRARHGAALYVFRTVHLARSEPGGAPWVTLRGDRLESAASITPPRIAAAADALARHVLARRFRAPPEMPRRPLGFHGDYDAVADAYDPLLAPPAEQALLAWGLAHYARAPGVDAGAADDAGAAAVMALRDLAAVVPGENDPLEDDRAVAAIVLAAAALENDTDPSVLALAGAARRRLRADPPTDATAHDLALRAAALAVSGATDTDRDLARAAIDAAWSAAAANPAELLPWIALAEHAAAGGAALPETSAARLRDLRGALDVVQIGAGDQGPPDLRGGYRLTARRSAAVTAQSLRPASALAVLLDRPETLDEGTSPAAALGRHLAAMRYLLQLAVGPDDAWRLRRPDLAVGGVRAATWSDHLPAAPQAIALFLAARSLHHLRGAESQDFSGDR